MTIYYLCCLEFNNFFCFNRSRYTNFNYFDNFCNIFTEIEHCYFLYIKRYIEYNVDTDIQFN